MDIENVLRFVHGVQCCEKSQFEMHRNDCTPLDSVTGERGTMLLEFFKTALGPFLMNHASFCKNEPRVRLPSVVIFLPQ